MSDRNSKLGCRKQSMVVLSIAEKKLNLYLSQAKILLDSEE